MAILNSSIVYGNLDVKGNLTINGEVMSDIGGGASNERVDKLEEANLTMAANLLNLQDSLNLLKNEFNGYQGPVELQVTSTHIQWRKAGATTWTNLIALSAITPSISALESNMNTFKSDMINQFANLETSVLNNLTTGISNAEIDEIINNALK